jgi:hypothetical protein
LQKGWTAAPQIAGGQKADVSQSTPGSDGVLIAVFGFIMSTAQYTGTGSRRERLWNWGFWMSIVAFEVLGVFLAHQS